eukprot:805462_1
MIVKDLPPLIRNVTYNTVTLIDTANILIINLTHVWIIQCVTYAASDLNIHSPVKCAKKQYCDICGIRKKRYRYGSLVQEKCRDVCMDWCKNCIVKTEHDKWDKAVLCGIRSNAFLSDTFDMQLSNIIAAYSYGFVVKCTASHCDEEIVIANKYEFVRNFVNLKPLSYTLSGKTERQTVFIYGERRRIFCMKCYYMRMKQCKVPDCTNYDEYDYCAAHKFCELCHKHPRPWLWPNQRNKFTCRNGLKRVCTYCYAFGGLGPRLCNHCNKTELLCLLFQPYIADKQIINVLSEYAQVSITYDDVNLYIGKQMIMNPWIEIVDPLAKKKK